MNNIASVEEVIESNLKLVRIELERLKLLERNNVRAVLIFRIERMLDSMFKVFLEEIRKYE